MARYIDAEKLYHKIFYSTDGTRMPFRDVDNFKVTIDLETLNHMIIDVPTADVQEVKHGKWLYENYECSFCGESLKSIMDSDSYFSGDFKGCNYCPNCGAKMDKE